VEQGSIRKYGPRDVRFDFTDIEGEKLQESSPDAAFELVDVLVATAQNAVHMMCESITSRVSPVARKASNAPGL
jgi:hypothetical protein